MEEKSWSKQAKKVLPFMKKHAMLLTLLLVLVLQFVPNDAGAYPWGGMWMRMQTQELKVADRAAQQSMNSFVEQQARALANQQYPNLPAENRQKVIDDLVEKVKKENAKEIEQQRSNLAKEVREHYKYEADGAKFVYMPDIDPYYYLRYARNLVEKGHTYDELKDGVPWDNHMLAPIGTKSDPNWHPYVFALMYRVHSTFDSSVTLMQSAAYFPIVFILLSIVLAFLIAWRVAGNIGGFFAATMLAVLPAILGRTPWGHADTDAYNIFFPLLVVWLLVEAIYSKTTKNQLLFGGLTGFAIGLYMNFWIGWWYLFDLVAGALAVTFVIQLFIHRRKLLNVKALWAERSVRKPVLIGVSLFITSAFMSLFSTGFVNFLNRALFSGIKSTTIKDAALPTLWPNVLTTVAELNPASFDNVVAAVGGMLMFVIACIGIVLLLLRKDAQGRRDVTVSALLILWFAGTIYMSLKGTRFILLLGPAFAIAFGAAAGLITERVSRFAQKQVHIKKTVTTVILILVFCLIIVNPTKAGPHMVRGAYNSVVNDVPIVNDAWWETLTKIKEDSSPDAIVNSWWDFGHHFKYIADRAVTFDGGSQNSPQAHWIGRVLQTDNEKEAVAILRMLDCGGNNAFKEAQAKFEDPLKSVEFVKDIIMLDKASAVEMANAAGVPSVVDFTHCEPPENYFIASGDMIGKAGVWSHFGLWDFQKAEVWRQWRKLSRSEAVPQMVERFNMSEERASTLYDEASALAGEQAANQWISPWVGYITQNAVDCNSGEVLQCGNAIAINLTSQVAEVRIQQGVARAGRVVVYAKDGSKTVLAPEGGNDELTIVVWPRNNNAFRAIAGYSQIADGMFTRLYFMEGLGLSYFDKFSSANQLIGGAVHAYKVDWSGSSAYIPDNLVPKEQVEQGATLAVNYIGWTDEGIFDSSIVDWQAKNISELAEFDAFETRPLQVVYGKTQLIPGFVEGLKGMKAGEVKTITIPPKKGYGTDPSKHELGNKTLHFKIQVVALE